MAQAGQPGALPLETAPDGERSDDDFVAGTFSEEIMVSLVSVAARVVDPYGVPVQDLAPADLVARIGGIEVDVTAVDFHTYGRSESTVEMPEAFSESERQARLEFTVPQTPTRFLVIVMQIGGHDVSFMDPSYVRGHLQSLPGLMELIDGLPPSDRVALLSYDVKLKIWSDFTTDREAVKGLLFDTIGFATPPQAEAPDSGPSLRRWIHPGRLEEATSPGEAMAVLAKALAAIEGPKDVLYVGWDITGYRGMLSGLERAEAVVSVLDVTQADYHLLGEPLKAVAQATGGTYESLFRFPKRGARRVARTITGYQIITLDLDAARGHSGELEIRVPNRDVAVHMKKYFF